MAYYTFAAAGLECGKLKTLSSTNYMIHVMVPTGSPGEAHSQLLELYLENHRAASRLRLSKHTFLFRCGAGQYVPQGESGDPVALLLAMHKGAFNAMVLGKDALCVKRAGEIAGVTTVGDFFSEAGLVNNPEAVWGHAHPQQARGPRQLYVRS